MSAVGSYPVCSHESVPSACTSTASVQLTQIYTRPRLPLYIPLAVYCSTMKYRLQLYQLHVAEAVLCTAALYVVYLYVECTSNVRSTVYRVDHTSQYTSSPRTQLNYPEQREQLYF